jgi:heme/copper-type cytochrome/quinol oxidase subunit 2
MSGGRAVEDMWFRVVLVVVALFLALIVFKLRFVFVRANMRLYNWDWPDTKQRRYANLLAGFFFVVVIIWSAFLLTYDFS